MRRRAEDVRRRRRETESVSPAAPPVPAGRHGGPPDVVVVVKSRSPYDPGRRVNATGYPPPTAAADPSPTAIMERSPAPAEIADPHPRVARAEPPVTMADVGREVGSDHETARHPNDAVRRVFLPSSVRRQRIAEVVERGRIGIGGVVVFGWGRRLARWSGLIRRGGLGWRRRSGRVGVGWRRGGGKRRQRWRRGDGLARQRSTRLGGSDLRARRPFRRRLGLTRCGFLLRSHIGRPRGHEHGRSQTRRVASPQKLHHRT